MRRLLGLLILCLWLAPAAADTGKSIAIEEWAVPFERGRPRDPAVGPDGSIWFVGQQNHYLARFDPGTQKFSQRKLPDRAGPHNLIVGNDGIVWYAGNKRGYIGRHDPVTDKFDNIPMPTSDAGDPHTLVFDSDQTHIWFTVQWGNFIGRLNVQSRNVKLIEVPTSNARPYGIIVAPNGHLWVALLGTNKLASVDPVTLAISEHDLPDPDSGPRRLVATKAGDIVYVDFSQGRLGRYDPVSRKVTEFPAPAGDGSGPYAMAIDEQERVWFVETGPRPNRFVGFDSRTNRFVSQSDIPSGAGSVRHMVYDEKTNAIWFGTDAGTLGRAQLN